MNRLNAFGSLAYLFDKDGTLIDTETLYYQAFDRLLRLRAAQHDFETHAQMMGTPMDTCLRILQEKHGVLSSEAADFASHIEEMADILADIRKERGTLPMPGAQAFLDQCRLKGIRIGLATSAQRKNTERDLETLGWRDRFEAIVTSNDVTNHKPAPDIYLEAARRLGLPPDQCLAFEDGIKGVQSAHAAGMHVIFVRDARFGITPPDNCALVINSFEELME